MKKHLVIGLSQKETARIAEELNIKIIVDSGTVNFSSEKYSWEDCEEMLIDKVNKDYKLQISPDAEIISGDITKQDDFYLGIIYQEEKVTTILAKDIGPITEKEVEEIKKAAEKEIEFDEDCPELTEEQLKKFKRGRLKDLGWLK